MQLEVLFSLIVGITFSKCHTINLNPRQLLQVLRSLLILDQLLSQQILFLSIQYLNFFFQYFYFTLQKNINTFMDQPLLGTVVFNDYQVVGKLGQGAFAQIYKVQHTVEKNVFKAIKTEPVSAKFPQLVFESRLLEYIHNVEPKEGIPKPYGISKEGGHNLLLMELLGKNLDHYFSEQKKKFSLKTVLKIGIQVLDRLEILHDKGFIHRDLKPENLVFGGETAKRRIYLIDLGLSKRFLVDNQTHVSMKKGNQLVGTIRYASISNHKGFQQSRRDDIQSLAYILAYFFRGSLPWQSLKSDSIKVKIEMIKNKKISTNPEAIAVQPEIAKFIQYSRQLKFQQRPNYNHLKNLLKKAAENNNINIDDKYDWQTD